MGMQREGNLAQTRISGVGDLVVSQALENKSLNQRIRGGLVVGRTSQIEGTAWTQARR